MGLDSPRGCGCFNFLEAQSDSLYTGRGKLGTEETESGKKKKKKEEEKKVEAGKRKIFLWLNFFVTVPIYVDYI